MEEQILIISEKITMVTKSIIFSLLEQEKDVILYTHSAKIDSIEYADIQVIDDLTSIKDVNQVIFIDYSNYDEIISELDHNELSVIYISNDIKKVKRVSYKINYIKTPLILDEEEYSYSKKLFLFKKGIYHVLNNEIFYFLEDDRKYSNLIIDITNSITEDSDYVFKFDSLTDSYSWLEKMLDKQNAKVFNFCLPRVYNDSDKEIKYLIHKIKSIKNGMKIQDVFIGNSEEIAKLKENVFFQMLLKELSDKYKIYIVDIDEIKTHLGDDFNKILYGTIIYEDCVYIDYLDNEISLGYVDCKQESLDNYNEIFGDVLHHLAVRIEKEGDLDEL